MSLFRSACDARRPRVRLRPGVLAILVLVFVLGGGLAGLALGQFGQFGQLNNRGAPPFDPNSSGPAAAKHLLIAADHARGGHWSEAVQMYQKVIEQFGERVTELPAEGALAGPGAGAANAGEFVLYVDDRWYCHRAISKLPPEARAIYRRRVDGTAERWFRQGQSGRDLTLLRRVVDQMFCSSWGDDALELLGDLAFQDGRFGEARTAYGRIVADHPEDPLTLVHPDPSVELARVAAKKLLCRAAAGENLPGSADLNEFRKRYPGATGKLAGRNGEYAEIVAQALKSDGLGPPRERDNRWPTFAGSFERTRIVPAPIDVGSMQWRVDLEKVMISQAPTFNPRTGMGGGPVSLAQDRLLAYHTIVLGDQVIVGDGFRVQAFNLNDRPQEGENSTPRLINPVWKYPADDDPAVPHVRPGNSGIPRYTLTAAGNKIYARMTLHGATSTAGFGSRNGIELDRCWLDWSRPGEDLVGAEVERSGPTQQRLRPVKATGW